MAGRSIASDYHIKERDTATLITNPHNHAQPYWKSRIPLLGATVPRGLSQAPDIPCRVCFWETRARAYPSNLVCNRNKRRLAIAIRLRWRRVGILVGLVETQSACNLEPIDLSRLKGTLFSQHSRTFDCRCRLDNGGSPAKAKLAYRFLTDEWQSHVVIQFQFWNELYRCRFISFYRKERI